MKKAGQLLAVLTAASVLLSGCEKLKDVTTTSVYVSKNGVVTEAIVEDYSKDDDYTEDELKVFVEDDIKKFTEERGDADSVKLEKCQIKEDKVEIRMEYGDYQSYADYHGAEFFAGTLDEAEEAGYDFSASFVDSKGNEVSVEDAVKGVKHVRVIVCEEPLEIVTEDPVLCVSGTAVIKGKNTVDTPASGPQSPQRVILRHHQSRLRQKKQSRNMSRTFFLPVLLLLFMVSKQIK